MSLQDPISNLLSSIKNAHSRNKDGLTVPSSSQKVELLKVFQKEGYIDSFKATDSEKPELSIKLKYFNNKPVIKELKRVSKPGLREYVGKNEVPLIKGGLGMAVISTSKGLMTDKEAREAGLGGEVVCSIF